MVTNNKVLTVSYGTFSCTLEGFDDSFDAMKAIAEYFRDLAADDRYFGAEPPTPDAEMLARIAEREVERRVQARHEHGTLVLSAAEPVAQTDTRAGTAPMTQAENTPQPEAASEQSTAVEEDSITEATAPVVSDPADADLPQEPQATVESPDPAFDAQVNNETQAYSFEEATEAAPEDESQAPYVLNAALMDEDRAAPEAAFVDGPVETTVEEAAQEVESASFAAAAPLVADASNIAAKLSRIRAVVSRTGQSSEDFEDAAEAESPDEFLHQTAEEIEADQIEEAHTLGESPVPAQHEDAVTETAEAPVEARVIRMKKSELDDALESGLIEETETGFDEAAPLEEASAENLFVEQPPEVADANEGLLLDTSLSTAEEAELMAELADVDAELDLPTDAAVDRRENRASQLARDVPQDEAVDRLIEEANSKLDEPEGNRRRTAIAHLRRAVEATKAEKEAGVLKEKEDESAAYREDLADVMRPHRNVEQPYGQVRERKASPLKLVAEQRIDAASASSADRAKADDSTKHAPVRPRRVAVAETSEAETEENQKFIDYAERMGATELPDLLEAAAAYLIHVEGRRRFSRPALMRLAYLFRDKRTEREACLRSFGQLLREGKIEKIAGGRFTVSDTINFKPQDRAAS